MRAEAALHAGPVGRLVGTRPCEHRQLLRPSVVSRDADGSRQNLPLSSDAGQAATCSGETAAALARPLIHFCALQRAPARVFHAIGTRKPVERVGNARNVFSLWAEQRNFGLRPNTRSWTATTTGANLG